MATYMDLIGHLPEGDVQYVRCDDRTWGVAIFAPDGVERRATVAVGMDKNVAAWLAQRLRDARHQPHTHDINREVQK